MAAGIETTTAIGIATITIGTGITTTGTAGIIDRRRPLAEKRPARETAAGFPHFSRPPYLKRAL